MAEFGFVTKVMEDEVLVRLQRSEACAKCGACTAGFETKDMFIEAKNMCNAKENEWVEIHLDESNFIQAVLIMYGAPLGGLLAGILIGFGLGTLFFNDLTDFLSIILGLVGAGLTFIVIHKNEKRFKTNKYKPRATRIVEAKDACS